MFDENLTSMSQINLICKKAMLSIRSIGRIKKYLSKDDLARVVNAFVIPILTIAIVCYMVFPSLNLTSFKGSKMSQHV